MPEVTHRQQMWKDMYDEDKNSYSHAQDKAAELSGTWDMPWSRPAEDKKSPKDKVSTKTAGSQSIDDVLQEAFKVADATALPPGVSVAPSGEQPKSLPQAKQLHPHVDVAGKEAPKTMTVKKASLYALPSREMYPLDGYDQVIKAASYFEENAVLMSPEMRREYCVNMVKRAHALGIPAGEAAERYGSETYAPPEQVKIALDVRRSLLQDEEHVLVLEKLAEARSFMNPEIFAEALGQFDHLTGLDQQYGDIPDPFFSTFAKVGEAAADESIMVGNEYITKRKLQEFSKRSQHSVKDLFGKDFAVEFAKNCFTIFDSLPRDQKLVIMRMANTEGDATA